MFDLEKQIAEWRREMLAAGISRPEILSELESHLRDDLKKEARKGSSVDNAFETAKLRLGHGEMLKNEFSKLRGTSASSKRMKTAVFVLAGIPNAHSDVSIDTAESNIEPRWATYCKTIVFLMPAAILFALSAMFIVPEEKSVWAIYGEGTYPGWIPQLIHLNFDLIYFMKDHLFNLLGATLFALVLVELRFRAWPRYRRAVLGAATFSLSSLVVLSFFALFLMAALSNVQLLKHAK